MNNKFIKIYANFLKKNLKPTKPLKIVFDCSNGTTGIILKQLLRTTNYGLRTILINQIPDGNFPAHGPNPLAPNATSQLQKEVIKQKADLGIIFDADGDRVFFIDNKGKFINPDVIANLLIWRLNPKKVITDVRTGWLVKNLKSQISNLKIINSRVGHYFIKKLMRKIDVDFGAEQSGHYYFKNFFYCDSGIMAALEVINAISKLPYKLSDYIDLLPQYYRSGEINIKMNYKIGIVNYEKLFKKIENYFKSQTTYYKLLTTNYLDGLTMEFKDSIANHGFSEDWWFNLRPSNTEPLIRLNIEATNKKLLDKSLKKIYSLIRS